MAVQPDGSSSAAARPRQHVRPTVTAGPATSAHPSPEGWRHDGLLLADGTRVRFRPINHDDRDLVAALFGRMSETSRLRRYLSPKQELAPRELDYLTDIDHITHHAIAAVDERDGSIVAIGRYVADATRTGVADLAAEVIDELQNMGIGTALAKATLGRAAVNGFQLATATTAWDNRAARALLRKLGFRARKSGGGIIEHELRLSPAPSHPLTAAPAGGVAA